VPSRGESIGVKTSPNFETDENEPHGEYEIHPSCVTELLKKKRLPLAPLGCDTTSSGIPSPLISGMNATAFPNSPPMRGEGELIVCTTRLS
jgi:hypothetical protein